MNTNIEYENIWEQYKKLTIRKLMSRGLDEMEAMSVVEIFSNLQEKRKPVYQLEILKEVLKNGDQLHGCEGQPLAHYGEIKKMIDQLQDSITSQGLQNGRVNRSTQYR